MPSTRNQLNRTTYFEPLRLGDLLAQPLVSSARSVIAGSDRRRPAIVLVAGVGVGVGVQIAGPPQVQDAEGVSRK